MSNFMSLNVNYYSIHKSHFLCISLVCVWIRLLRFAFMFLLFFFFFFSLLLHTCLGDKRLLFMNSSRILLTFQPLLSFLWVPWIVHRTHKLHFSAIFSLKMGLMALFTHLKIILLQYFQFQQNKFYPNGPLKYKNLKYTHL